MRDAGKLIGLLFLISLSCARLSAQDSNLYRPREAVFLRTGFIQPLKFSRSKKATAFELRANKDVSMEIGYRRFMNQKPWFLQADFCKHEISADYLMTQAMAKLLNPDNPLQINMSGWQKITDVQLGIGYQYQPVRWWYVQPAVSLGIASFGTFHDMFFYRSDTVRSVEVVGGPILLAREWSGSFQLSVETGVNIGKHHSIGLQASYLKYGIFPFFFGTTVHTGRYFISNGFKSHEVHTGMNPRLYSFSLAYQYRF